MSCTIGRKLIDIGANLTDSMFRGIYRSSQKHPDDFHPMINRAKESGVDKFIITGGSLSDSVDAIKLADTDTSFFATVGCHPTRCNEFRDYKDGPERYLEELEKLIVGNRLKVVAVGETGLDYDRTQFCDVPTQKLYFERQLDLAERVKLPLFLHNRNSALDLVDILRRNKTKIAPKAGVVHSFDGTQQDLDAFLNLNLYIGVNGCSLKTDQNLETVKLIPDDRLLIETDCPWCEIKSTHSSFKHVKSVFQKSKNASDPKLPVKNRNEPCQLVQVLEVVAALKGSDVDCLAKQIYDNTMRLFFNE